MGLLDGHRAIVTGGASGMGAATARRMVEEGASVAVFDQNGDGSAEVAGEIGGHAFEVGVANWAQVSDSVEAAAEKLGGLSILHNNAGVSTSSGIEETEPEEFARIVGVEPHGCLLRNEGGRTAHAESR
jgi:NAD(P)-dependent dehydrogenase (short-subunit alcohol dehydrogenase family)